MSYLQGSNTYGTEAMTSSEPAAELEAAAGPDAPTETIVIQGFDFDGCAAPGCLNLTPCPRHQPHAWQEQANKLRRQA